MRNGKTHIVLGLPTRGFSVSLGIPSLIAYLFHEASRPECPFIFSFVVVAFSTPTETARNEVVKKFLDLPDADVLWFVDSDAMPAANSIKVCEAMLRPDVDVAGVMTPFLSGKLDKAFQYNIYKWNEERSSFNPLLPQADSCGLIEVDGMGTPGMAIKRAVLEDRRMWCGDRDAKYGANCPPVFRWVRASTGHTIMTDDLDFCMRARQLGYRLWADTRVRWGHIKEVDIMYMLNIASTAYKTGGGPPDPGTQEVREAYVGEPLAKAVNE